MARIAIHGFGRIGRSLMKAALKNNLFVHIYPNDRGERDTYIPIEPHMTVNLDQIQHYRPRVNVLERPTRGAGGRGLSLTGHHEILVPLLAQAVLALNPAPQLILVDGNQPLPLTFPQQPVIKGDAICPSISAASIVAKVYRDTLMERLHRRYPQYNFAGHKGYATAEHLEALRCWGPCELHRRTFRGVKEWLEEKK